MGTAQARKVADRRRRRRRRWLIHSNGGKGTASHSDCVWKQARVLDSASRDASSAPLLLCCAICMCVCVDGGERSTRSTRSIGQHADAKGVRKRKRDKGHVGVLSYRSAFFALCHHLPRPHSIAQPGQGQWTPTRMRCPRVWVHRIAQYWSEPRAGSVHTSNARNGDRAPLASRLGFSALFWSHSKGARSLEGG